jgi:hypothetical protein
MRFLDTMSMHIACCGFTSEQRTIILNKEDPFQDIDTSTKNRNFQRNKNNIKVKKEKPYLMCRNKLFVTGGR